MPYPVGEKVAAVFFSDVHLGALVCYAERLVTMLNKFNPDFIRIIGDLYDDCNLHRLKRKHWELLDLLRKRSKHKDVLHIHGNHDDLLESLGEFLGIQVVSESIWEYKDLKILLIHGHQFDRYIAEKPIITWVASELYNLIQRFGGKKQSLARFLKRQSKQYLRLSREISLKLVRYAKDKNVGINTIIFGHTHEIMDEMIDGIRVMNDGCVTDNPSTCIICDMEGNLYHYEMKEFE